MLTQILSILEPKTSKSKSENSQTLSSKDVDKSETPFSYHHYWMVYIKNVLDNTIPEYQQRIENYKTFLGSLSGALVIGGIAWTSYVDSTNWKVFVLIFGPVVILQLARLIINVILDRTDFFQIEDITDSTHVHMAHNTKVATLSKKATLAKYPVFIASIVFLVCVPWGIFLHNQDRSNSLESSEIIFSHDDIYLNAIIPNGENPKIHFTGRLIDKKRDTTIIRRFNFNEQGNLNLHFNNHLLGLVTTQVLFEYEHDGLQKAILKSRVNQKKLKK